MGAIKIDIKAKCGGCLKDFQPDQISSSVIKDEPNHSNYWLKISFTGPHANCPRKVTIVMVRRIIVQLVATTKRGASEILRREWTRRQITSHAMCECNSPGLSVPMVEDENEDTGADVYMYDVLFPDHRHCKSFTFTLTRDIQNVG